MLDARLAPLRLRLADVIRAYFISNRRRPRLCVPVFFYGRFQGSVANCTHFLLRSGAPFQSAALWCGLKERVGCGERGVRREHGKGHAATLSEEWVLLSGQAVGETRKLKSPPQLCTHPTPPPVTKTQEASMFDTV